MQDIGHMTQDQNPKKLNETHRYIDNNKLGKSLFSKDYIVSLSDISESEIPMIFFL